MHTLYDTPLITPLALMQELIKDLKEDKVEQINLLNGLFKSSLLKEDKTGVKETIKDLVDHCKKALKNNTNMQDPRTNNTLYILSYLTYFDLIDLKNNKYFQRSMKKQSTQDPKVHIPSEKSKTQHLALLQRAAKFCPEAMYELGLLHLKGYKISKKIQIPLDISTAIELLETAANAGNYHARNQLGEMYLKGQCFSQDKKKAFEIFTKAADENNPEAKLNLAKIYLNGNGVLLNEKKAFALVKDALKSDLPEPLIFMGDIYRDGIGVNRNVNLAISFYRKANIFNSVGDFLEGKIYQNNNDIEKAVSCYKRAMSRGHIGVLNSMANLLINATTDVDYSSESDSFFEKVLNRLFNQAKPTNYSEGMKLLDIAIDEYNHPAASNQLGILFYAESDETKPDLIKKAAAFFRKGTKGFNLWAMYNYANALENGLGVTQNLKEAEQLYIRCANNQVVDAQHKLALILEKKGTGKDIIQAARWYRQAASKNFKESQDKLNDPENKLYYYHSLMSVLSITSVKQMVKLQNVEKAAALAVKFPDLLNELLEFDCEQIFMKNSKVDFTFFRHFIDMYIGAYHSAILKQAPNLSPKFLSRMCFEGLKKLSAYEGKLDTVPEALQQFKRYCLIQVGMNYIDAADLFNMMTQVMDAWSNIPDKSENRIDQALDERIVNILTQGLQRIKDCGKELDTDCNNSFLQRVIKTIKESKKLDFNPEALTLSVDSILELVKLGSGKLAAPTTPCSGFLTPNGKEIGSLLLFSNKNATPVNMSINHSGQKNEIQINNSSKNRNVF